MKEVAQLLNEMRGEGVITDYALFGAVAQMRYTEPVATLDADVPVVSHPLRGSMFSARFTISARERDTTWRGSRFGWELGRSSSSPCSAP